MTMTGSEKIMNVIRIHDELVVALKEFTGRDVLGILSDASLVSSGRPHTLRIHVSEEFWNLLQQEGLFAGRDIIDNPDWGTSIGSRGTETSAQLGDGVQIFKLEVES